MSPLCRYLSHLTRHTAPSEDLGALLVYLNTKLTTVQHPGSSATSLPGPQQPYGNPYGSPQPYLQLSDRPAAFDWPFLVGVLRGAETSLPVERASPSPDNSRRGTRDEQPGGLYAEAEAAQGFAGLQSDNPEARAAAEEAAAAAALAEARRREEEEDEEEERGRLMYRCVLVSRMQCWHSCKRAHG